MNHCISKQIVNFADRGDLAIALEDLTYIRTTAKRQKKTQRRMLHHWAFNQLRNFISYKAQRVGIPVVIVEAAYTSQICSVCDSLGIRSNEHFSCLSCSFESDADYNASLNIRRAAVNQPIVAFDEAKARERNAAENSYKFMT